MKLEIEFPDSTLSALHQAPNEFAHSTAMDALHLASAIEGKAEYFLTTDKNIRRKMKLVVRQALILR